jgi:hypothetical protein
MPTESRIVAPCPFPRSVRTERGDILYPPVDWVLVPPGDPALTRRIKAAGPCWTVQEKKGRKVFSRGIWTLGSTVESIRRELEAERADPAYAKKLAQAKVRRDEDQAAYVEEFEKTVLDYLRFNPAHAAIAQQLACAVTTHATPVGSGTVARTERIPVDERAEAAVIAWMRHQTTAYDSMPIPRIKGKRREVRRMLAMRSKSLLQSYREGRPASDACPLQRALRNDEMTRTTSS